MKLVEANSVSILNITTATFRRVIQFACLSGCVLLCLQSYGDDGDSPPFPFSVASTEMIRRADPQPLGEIRVTIDRGLRKESTVSVRGADGVEQAQATVAEGSMGTIVRLPIPLPTPGSTLTFDVILHEGDEAHFRQIEVPAPDPDWVMYFIPGFHYDPVWWNTQEHYTETGHYMDAHVGPGLELVGEYLDTLARDPDHHVSFHQLPYLKSFLEARPWRRKELLEQVAAGSVGVVGGTYNELSTTLVGSEAVVRNAAYGTLWQREVFGDSGSTFWQCDVFGHDPSFPSLMAQSGHRGGVFGRGPFHQWGTDRDRVNFPSEFYWASPDGDSILTHYLTGHYGYAYAKFASGSNRASDDRQQTRSLVASMFEDLKQPAATHHVLLPMHMDFIRPLENLGDIVRDWNETYIAPRAVIDTSAGFFAAVEAEVAEKKIVLPVITRDMNPIYTGCGVSFSDLKIAEREVETTLREAELYATIAAIEGAEFPDRAIDRAWRQLLFNAHHDGVTGSMSDQVYIDLLWAYRDALSIAKQVRFAALCYLSAKVAGDSPLIWNPVAHSREGVWTAFGLQDDRRSLYRAELPPLGVRRLQSEASITENKSRGNRPVLVNEHLRLEFDLQQGGAIVSMIDRRSGQELLSGPANDVVLCEEYSVLPGHGEGPWHLSPTGERRSGTGVVARLLRDATRPYQIEIEARYPEFTKRQTVELLPGSRRVNCETTITRWQGRNQLLRVEFPFRFPGAHPVYQTAAAVIGRPFARDVDTAVDPWTLDQTCAQWFGLGRVAAIEIVPADGPPLRRALGVGEIIVGDDVMPERLEQANELALQLVEQGVTTTVTRAGSRRYGNLDDDSNLPDFRLYLGEADEIDFVAQLDSVPRPLGLDPLTGIRYFEPGSLTATDASSFDLPTLVVRPRVETLRQLSSSLQRESSIVIPSEAASLSQSPHLEDRGVAVINEGAISGRVEADGRLSLNLLRSCTGWPSGIWIDPPDRSHPDGTPLGAMHGSHRFRYSILPHRGTYREAEISKEAQEVQHPPIRQFYRQGDGSIPDGKSWFSVEPPTVQLTAFKPAGFDLARWSEGESPRRVNRVVARLWNGSGHAVRARCRPGFKIIGATQTDLLEGGGRLLTINADGVVDVELDSHELTTIVFDLEPVMGEDGKPEAPVPLDIEGEETIPSAYWLENRGEGVDGNGVCALALRDRDLVVDAGGSETVLHVVNNHRFRSITVPVTVRAPAALQVILDPPLVTIAPGESAPIEVRVVPRTEWRGRSAVEFATQQGDSAVTATLWVRDSETPIDEPVVDLEIGERLVLPRGKVRATLRNRTDGPLRGVLAWLSPQPAWNALTDWRRSIELPPGGEVEIESSLASPIDSYVIPRFTTGGEIVYGESIALLEMTQQVLLAFDVDRVRVTESGLGVTTITAMARRSLDASSEITLTGPEGWRIEELAREFFPATSEDPVQRLVVTYAVGVVGEGAGGPLIAVGPARSRAVVDTTIAPIQESRRPDSLPVIDGDLSEWEESEFTTVSDELGSVRTAVRFDGGGLTFAFEVQDEVFRQTHTAATIWEGDSVQIALTAAPGTEIGYSSSDLEFGSALTSAGPLVWCWYAGPEGQTGVVTEADVAISRDEKSIRYEFRIPRTRLPGINLEPGARLGFSYIANDDDGEGYRGATEWTAGMTGTKDSSQFGELHLITNE